LKRSSPHLSKEQQAALDQEEPKLKEPSPKKVKANSKEENQELEKSLEKEKVQTVVTATAVPAVQSEAQHVAPSN